jgi:hypothetical protein
VTATNVKLNLPERFNLVALLPEQGNLATLKLVRRLREALSHLSDQDKEACGWQDHNERFMKDAEGKEMKTPVGTPIFDPLFGQSTWERDFERTFRLTPSATALIVDLLRKRNEAGTLEAKHEGLAEKFLGKPTEACEAVEEEETREEEAA